MNNVFAMIAVVVLMNACADDKQAAGQSDPSGTPSPNTPEQAHERAESEQRSQTPVTKAQGIDLWSQEMGLIADAIDSVRDESSADQAVAHIQAIQNRLAATFSGPKNANVTDIASVDPQKIAGVQARMGQALMGLQMRQPGLMKKVTTQLQKMPELGMPAFGR